MSITIRLERHGPYLIAADQADPVTAVDADGNMLAPEPGRSTAPCDTGSE